MINISLTHQITFLAFWISFAKWSTTLIQTPLLDTAEIPPIIRILLIFLISFAFFDDVKSFIEQDLLFVGVENFIFIFVFYLIIGLIIGFMLKNIMMVFSSAGTFITQNIGFGTVKYFDPSQGQLIGPLEKLIQWTILIMVLNSGALNPIFKGILFSFQKFSFYNFQKGFFSVGYMIDFFKHVFAAAITLALPLTILNLVLQIILAMAGRIMPQMNIFVLSFIINISLGLLVFIFSADEFFLKAFDYYKTFLSNWYLTIT